MDELVPQLTSGPAVAQLPEPTKIVKIRKKRAPKHDFKDGIGRVFAHRHANGNGWVADTARVEEQVYIGPRAQVYNYACVRGQVRLEGRARVFGHATLDGRASGRDSGIVVKTNAQVYGNALIRDTTIIADDASVTGNARISGNSRIFGHAHVYQSAELISCVLNGRADVNGNAMAIRSTIVDAIVNGSCTLYASTINAVATIGGFATLIETSVFSHWTENPVLIRGHATLTKTNVYSPIVLDGHCICSHVNFYLSGGGTPLIVDGNHILRGRTFHDADSLTRALQNQSAPEQPPPPTNTPHIPVVAAGNNRQPVPLQPTRGRRVQRLVEMVAS
jgi:carbonic anhydrase/acetyltransferase-like protein (isoleucine patch superfamily)